MNKETVTTFTYNDHAIRILGDGRTELLVCALDVAAAIELGIKAISGWDERMDGYIENGWAHKRQLEDPRAKWTMLTLFGLNKFLEPLDPAITQPFTEWFVLVVIREMCRPQMEEDIKTGAKSCFTCKNSDSGIMDPTCNDCLSAAGVERVWWKNWTEREESKEDDAMKNCENCKHAALNPKHEPCATCVSMAAIDEWRKPWPKYESDPDGKNCSTCQHNPLHGDESPCDACLASEVAWANWTRIEQPKEKKEMAINTHFYNFGGATFRIITDENGIVGCVARDLFVAAGEQWYYLDALQRWEVPITKAELTTVKEVESVYNYSTNELYVIPVDEAEKLLKRFGTDLAMQLLQHLRERVAKIRETFGVKESANNEQPKEEKKMEKVVSIVKDAPWAEDKTVASYNGFDIRFDGEMMNLTNMWKATGSDKNKAPAQWVRLPSTTEFLSKLASKLNMDQSHIVSARRGGIHPGTFAHWQIALAYARYLSPDFHMWANQVVKERFEEEADPELGISRSRERAIRKWKAEGKSDAFIEARLRGIATRHRFTSAVGTHCGRFAACTNAVYETLFDTNAEGLRELLGAKNPRDAMVPFELCAVAMAEEGAVTALSGSEVKRLGTRKTEHTVSKVGRIVRRAMGDIQDVLND